jgi:hypothetical protein
LVDGGELVGAGAVVVEERHVRVLDVVQPVEPRVGSPPYSRARYPGWISGAVVRLQRLGYFPVFRTSVPEVAPGLNILDSSPSPP